MKETTLRAIELDQARHQPTGRTRHFVGGALWEGTRGLRIVRYEDDPGYYLLYIDQAGAEVTDTWHQSLSDALKQAAFEFNVHSEEWTLIADEPGH